MADKFSDFCLWQIERLSWFGYAYNQVPPGGVAQYAKWLERECAGDRAKASRIIDEACDAEHLPTGAELKAIAARLYPRPKSREASLDCEHCNGRGYEIVTNPDGTDGAKRCRCGGVPRSEPLTREELNAPMDEEMAALLREVVEAKSI